MLTMPNQSMPTPTPKYIYLCAMFFIGPLLLPTASCEAQENGVPQSQTMPCVYQSSTGMYGFTDASGEVIIEPVYEWAGRFDHGLVTVQRNGKYGMINPSGQTVIEVVYAKIGRPSKLPIPVSLDGERFAYFEPQSGELLTLRTSSVAWFVRPRLYVLWDDDGHQVSHVDTGPVSSQRYRKFQFGSDGPIVAMRADDGPKYDLIYGDGRVVPVDKEVSYIGDFNAGVAPFKRNDRWGILDADGSVRVEARFDSLGACRDHRMRFLQGAQFGYVDRDGKVVVPAKFDAAGNFSNGLASVRLKGQAGDVYIDTSGQVLPGGPFKKARGFSHGYAIVVGDDGTVRYVGRDLDTIAIFSDVQTAIFGDFLSDGYAYIEVDGKAGYINRDGEWVWRRPAEAVERPTFAILQHSLFIGDVDLERNKQD